jgi:hypothetical protein
MNISGVYAMNDVELFENITILPAESVERIRKTAKSQLEAGRRWKEKNREKNNEKRKTAYAENREERLEYQKDYYHNVAKKRIQEIKRLADLAVKAGIV